MQIACVNCQEFFDPDEVEVLAFIKNHADLNYLHRIKIPPKHKREFTDGKNLIQFLLLAYCPYCREVRFGTPLEAPIPRGGLSREKYYRGILSDLTKKSGFHVEYHEDEPLEFIWEDEDKARW